ncbi:hypothetical protein OG455_25980 [Kitasatospora sp. NBC_01287]|uniref:hypothetical protein n=1 Tax=Kitasatospora sp. NBC_01287 TaxID=2903573 RepID=UPI002257DA73|nr:hypothetical protein [Kitasatospora sp. NBC_01287]MCX4748925.1 hypothetical protein [Kitasatospora sp. NBC_01287]
MPTAHPLRTAVKALRAHPRLLLLAALAGALLAVAAAAVALAVLGPAAPPGGAAVLGGVGAFLLLLVATFLSAVLICAADDALAGRPVAIGVAFARAAGRLPGILGWSLLGGLLVAAGALLDRVPVVGLVLEKVFGVALGMLGYLVLPAMMIDGLGVFAALGQAGRQVRRSAGAQVRGTLWTMLPLLLALIPAAVVFILAVESDSHALTVLAVAGVGGWLSLAAMFSMSLSGLFRTLVYRGTRTAAAA